MKTKLQHARFIFLVSMLPLFWAVSGAFAWTPLPDHPMRATRYCTDAGTTWYCQLTQTGNVSGKPCWYGISGRDHVVGLTDGSNDRTLSGCLEYCSQWVCHEIKTQQLIDGNPVVGSPCCSSSNWTK